MPYRQIKDPDQMQALLDAVLAIESDLELPAVLLRIARAACSLTGARYGALGVLNPSGNGLEEFVNVGMDVETVEAIGQLPQGEGILGMLILDAQPLRLTRLSEHPLSVGFPPGHPPMRSFLGVPLRVRGEVFGNLYLTEREGGGDFTDEDERLVVAFAVAAGIVINNARLSARLAELGLAADRERIARDLHDTVIQRLFATGLSLQSVVPLMPEGELRSRIDDAVTELDDTIRQIRTTIFALERPTTADRGLRSRVLDICADAARTIGTEPEVRFIGAIDNLVDAPVATELLSTLRESMSNVVRHAQAHHVQVELSAAEDLTLRISDDGIGVDPPNDPLGKGLSNMRQRAESLGGSFSISRRVAGGTELTWRVPMTS